MVDGFGRVFGKPPWNKNQAQKLCFLLELLKKWDEDNRIRLWYGWYMMIWMIMRYVGDPSSPSNYKWFWFREYINPEQFESVWESYIVRQLIERILIDWWRVGVGGLFFLENPAIYLCIYVMFHYQFAFDFAFWWSSCPKHNTVGHKAFFFRQGFPDSLRRWMRIMTMRLSCQSFCACLDMCEDWCCWANKAWHITLEWVARVSMRHVIQYLYIFVKYLELTFFAALWQTT